MLKGEKNFQILLDLTCVGFFFLAVTETDLEMLSLRIYLVNLSFTYEQINFTQHGGSQSDLLSCE